MNDATLSTEYSSDSKPGWYFMKVTFLQDGTSRWLVKRGLTRWLSWKVATGTAPTMRQAMDDALAAMREDERK